MHPKDAEGIANSVDPDQTALLIWVCTVCPDLSVRKLRIITVIGFYKSSHLVIASKYESVHDKTNKMTCASSKDSDQPGHPYSLISLPCAKDPNFLHEHREDSDQTGQIPRLIWVFNGQTGHFVGFVVWRLICDLPVILIRVANGPRQANLLLIAYASSEGSGEPAHPCSLARTSAARSYKQWVKRNLQTESQIPGPSEWLGMRS